MYKHILIATDGSETADKGVEAGFGLAKAVGAKVTIITASEPFPVYDLVSKLGLLKDQEAIDKYDALSKEIADRILDRAAKVAAGFECEKLHVPNSSPANAILETAKARSCDLIILTSNGRRGIERLVLGSQASRVVQAAETSVLVVR